MMFTLNVKEIFTVEELMQESELQKRENIDERKQEFFSGQIEERFKRINWILAETNDYDYLPWAEHKNYMEIYRESYQKDFEDGDFLTLIEIPIDVGSKREIGEQFDIILAFFRELVTEYNILSCMVHSSEKELHCHLLIKTTFHLPSSFTEKFQNYLNRCGMYYEDVPDERADGEDAPLLNMLDYYAPENGKGYNPEDSIELVYDARSVKAIANPDMAIDKQERVLDAILEYFSSVEKREVRKVRMGNISKKDFYSKVIRFLKEEYKEPLDERELAVMLSRVEEAIFGYYVLEDLLNDDSISDIRVISPNKIRIKRYGKRLTSNLYFRDMHDYLRFCEGIAIRNGTDLSPENAVQNFTDKFTNKNAILRFDLCTEYVNSVSYPYIQIRKTSKIKKDIETLYREGMLELNIISYLLEKAKSATGILFTGKGGSGKTTLMNTLLDYIPYIKSVLVIQENEELFSYNHPDIMFQHTVTARMQNQREVGLEELARNGLLLDLDYFVIGEIKGKEALPFLNAAFTGHQCWASVHGDSSTNAMYKLADYVKYASDYSQEDALRMLRSLQVIVFMKDYKVQEISEIVGWDSEKKDLIYKLIYSRDDTERKVG